MANQYCKFLSNGLRLQSDFGRIKAMPCCVYPHQVYLDEERFDNVFESYYDIDTCIYCNHYATDESLTLREFSKTRVKGNPDNGKIAYIELSIDNDCNAACLSCTDSFSSTWVSQNKKFNIKTEHDYPDPQDNEKVIAQIFNKFDLSELQHIRFFGGEPLRSTTTELFLEKVVQLSDASNIEIHFSTNSSMLPTSNTIKLLEQFKSVEFGLSIDGIGKQNDYLRYPLRWEVIENTIDQLKALNLNSSFEVNCTVNVFNAYYCDRIVEWADERFKDIKFGRVNFGICFGDLHIASMPPELRELIINKYIDNPKFKQLIDVITSSGYAAHMRNRTMSYVDKWDHFRKLSWSDVFPEMIPYYQIA
jgi:sulfatase maturation enzyme AslB (radical SAM superfamily)